MQETQPPPSLERREHVEQPSTIEISRRRVSAPDSGQLINVIASRQWEVQVAVWDEMDWARIPEQVREILLELKREIAKSTATRMVVNVRKR